MTKLIMKGSFYFEVNKPPYVFGVWHGDVSGTISGNSHSGLHASVWRQEHGQPDLLVCLTGLMSDPESEHYANRIASLLNHHEIQKKILLHGTVQQQIDNMKASKP